MGGERLRADVRRLPDVARPCRRPRRPPPRPRRRVLRVRRGLARLRGRADAGSADRRTSALAAWTAAAAGGGALGWVLGGAITDTLGWEWVFLVNVAPCAIAAALIHATLPES